MSTPSSTSSDPRQTGDSELPPRIPRLGWAIAFIAATMAIAFAYTSLKSVQPPASSRFEKLAKVPDFSFTAQDGSSVSSADMRGKLWIANFIFTRCTGPCPVMTSRMAEVNQQLSRAPGVELISVSVDPEYDTPQVLAKYGERVTAKIPKWRFLTGPKDKIDDFIVKGMLLPLSSEPTGAPIHSTRFVLVDGEGWIRGYEDGNDPEVAQKLILDIGELMREAKSQ